jgi:hypothetical protein
MVRQLDHVAGGIHTAGLVGGQQRRNASVRDGQAMVFERDCLGLDRYHPAGIDERIYVLHGSVLAAAGSIAQATHRSDGCLGQEELAGNAFSSNGLSRYNRPRRLMTGTLTGENA